MKRLLIIVITLLILAIIGGGLYFYISRNKLAPIAKDPTYTFPANGDLVATEDNTTDTGIELPGTEPSNTTINEIPETDDGEVKPKVNLFKKIAPGPIAQSPRIFGTTEKKSLLIRYVDSSTGRVFEYRPLTGNTSRLTITTIPRVKESYFTQGGTRLLLRYLNDSQKIENFIGDLPKPTSTVPLEQAFTGSFINRNLQSVSMSPKDDRFAYVERRPDNSARVYVGTLAEKGDTLVSSLPLFEWLISWPKSDTVLINSKPASSVDGFLYGVRANGSNTTLNGLLKILGDINGLTTLASPDLTQVIYSVSGKDRLDTFIYDLKTKKSRPFPVSTLPEKCVWSTSDSNIVYCAAPEQLPRTEYPDEWYKGGGFFNDLLWKIDTETDSSGILFIPEKEAGINIDMTSLILSPDGSYLIFTNKKDSSLWGFDLDKLKEFY